MGVRIHLVLLPLPAAHKGGRVARRQGATSARGALKVGDNTDKLETYITDERLYKIESII